MARKKKSSPRSHSSPKGKSSRASHSPEMDVGDVIIEGVAEEIDPTTEANTKANPKTNSKTDSAIPKFPMLVGLGALLLGLGGVILGGFSYLELSSRVSAPDLEAEIDARLSSVVSDFDERLDSRLGEILAPTLGELSRINERLDNISSSEVSAVSRAEFESLKSSLASLESDLSTLRDEALPPVSEPPPNLADEAPPSPADESLIGEVVSPPPQSTDAPPPPSGSWWDRLLSSFSVTRIGPSSVEE